jgi:class 3 adenylate cyclase
VVVSDINGERLKHSAYCRDHLQEFGYELCDEASLLIRGWVGRVFLLLILVTSVATYRYAIQTNNPIALLTLFAYALPVIIVGSFPIIINFYSDIEKFSPAIVDAVSITSLLSFAFIGYVLFANVDTQVEREILSNRLAGQVNFMLLIVIALSYHATYQVTIIRNLLLIVVFSALIFWVDKDFFAVSVLQLLQGFLSGSIVSWIFYDGIRARFYSRSTDASTRQHLYNQLSKLVYSHQLEMIKNGEELEATMPLKEGKAIVSVFDVQRSTEIKHEKTQAFFLNVFESFLEICMRGYEHNPLRSRAFRLKETGDGFISTVGYPFLPTEARSLADSAVSTALTMLDAFNKEVEKFNYSRPIKASIGLAYNSIQGTFQSAGIRSYDLFGEAIVQAAKYEELRKRPELWDLFSKHAAKLGLEHFHLLIVQEVVYNSLSPSYRDLFVEVDLTDPRVFTGEEDMRYDTEARYIYFYVTE